MNETEVTMSGQGTGQGTERRSGQGTGRRHRQPEFRSYYGKPILKEPTWEARDIAGYLFLGGLAGASSVVGAAAELTGRSSLARTAKLGAAGAIGLSGVALVHDLGKPGRFINMLRVFKPTSPMNVGSWLLTAYAPAAATSAFAAITGAVPLLGRAGTSAAAVLGPAVAAYTAVLIADTAVPAWHEGRHEMPFVFVGSAASSAAGWGLLTAPLAETAPMRHLALLAGTAELIGSRIMEKRMGPVGEVYGTGTAGWCMRAATVTTATGVVTAGVFGRKHRAAAVGAGLCLLAGSALTRFGIFHAGVASSRDPKYTVGPQRRSMQSD